MESNSDTGSEEEGSGSEGDGENMTAKHPTRKEDIELVEINSSSGVLEY